MTDTDIDRSTTGAWAVSLVERLMKAFADMPVDHQHLELMNEASAFVGGRPFEVNPKELGMFEQVLGMPRSEFQTVDDYAEVVDSRLIDQHEEFTHHRETLRLADLPPSKW